MAVKLELAGAVEQSIVVETLADDARAPYQAVVPFGHGPVVQQFQTAAAEADGVQRGGKRHSASDHGDVDMVAIGLQIDTQTGRRKRKVGGDVGKLVGGRELRVDHGSSSSSPRCVRALRCDCRGSPSIAPRECCPAASGTAGSHRSRMPETRSYDWRCVHNRVCRCLADRCPARIRNSEGSHRRQAKVTGTEFSAPPEKSG